MTNSSLLKIACCLAALFAMAGCGKKFNPASGAASPAQVVETGNGGLITVDHPEQFPLVAAGRIEQPDKLNVTGSVFPDISREIPVISMANGRVVDIKARLDDNVKKGQLLFSVQSLDISNAFDTYVKASADEQLANKAYLRAQDLYQHGAISQAMLEQAEDTEKDAKADLVAADEQLKIFGVNKEHPSPIVNVFAPTSGVIVAQNITNDAAAGVTLSGTATAFTIADLSEVWILCDVYENDLPKVRLGQEAQINLAAYPGNLLTGRVSDIGPVLDPTIRTAKVRIEVANPGILRLGMFVTATLLSRTATTHATVPATAILHLHDREWVYVPEGQGQFKRVEVDAGDMLPGGQQVILSGLAPDDQVVKDVLNLEATVEAQ
ncbi:MAG: efflux RND transporter periplasmic adaptor subunit [Terracidiphilus sp.]|jgi:cobalt-zinc-cadmium efflux system membrane fusion protein